MDAICMIPKPWLPAASPTIALGATLPSPKPGPLTQPPHRGNSTDHEHTTRPGHWRGRLPGLASLRCLAGGRLFVTAVDNLLTGRQSNLNHLRHEARFELREIDINQPFDCGKVDYVFHFASPASPVDYSIHGIATLKVGSLGTFHALDVAHRYGAKYLVSSTSECYGDPLEHPQKETYWGNVNPIGPRSVYDEAKRFTEAVTMAYHRYHKVDTRIVRIFNTYGPR